MQFYSHDLFSLNIILIYKIIIIPKIKIQNLCFI
jgi:hypothetical protein